MKIILDTDGTLTNFNDFINNNAIGYFKEKYGMEVVYKEKLEVEDILDMKNFFMSKFNCTEEEALEMQKKALDEFWISFNFIKFSLLDKFRPGVSEFINDMIKQGHTFEVHTSRAKTTEKSIVGEIARKFTILQYKLNGVHLSKEAFNFYKNDEEKIKGIINSNPDLALEDKPEIINALNKNNIKTICIEGHHNKLIEETKNNVKLSSYDKETIEEKIKKVIGVKNIKFFNRAANSDLFFNKIKVIKKPLLKFFNPIILNEQNLIKESKDGIIYSPNHVSTLDPLALMGVLAVNIHWAALKRFFTGNDSIFNNSKNPVLCKLTSNTFKKLEYFPIERKSDTDKPNNLNSVKDMVGFLSINEKIGIFPEGTTRKEEGKDFGEFENSFIALAKKTNSWVQPITILWIKDLNIKSKVIINYGKPFKIDNMSIDEALEYYKEMQKENLEENKTLKLELQNKKTR